jgi:hypothetical protein
MAMTEELELSQGKTVGDLALDAFWFFAHTFFAVLILALMIGAVSLGHPSPDAAGPKLIATALAFFVPMVGGLIIARIQGNPVARYVWISGLLLFCAVAVWVVGLPTGSGLCEACANAPLQKIWRTFFDINHGSGLMGGEGLLVGTWLPLSMIGYAAGAALGLEV